MDLKAFDIDEFFTFDKKLHEVNSVLEEVSTPKTC